MKPNVSKIVGGKWKLVYAEPDPTHTYVIGCDTASGKENANETVGTVLDVNTGVQVATLGGLITPEDFAVEVEKAGYLYNEACIGVEKEYHGVTVLNHLRQKEYPNIYFHPVHITAFNSGGATEFGWDARRCRQIAIDWLQRDFGWSVSTVKEERKRAVFLKDPETISQMGYFERNRKTGKFQAASGKFDDRVCALYIANYIRNEKWPDVFAPEQIPEPELTFLDKIAMEQNSVDDRSMGRRDLGY